MTDFCRQAHRSTQNDLTLSSSSSEDDHDLFASDDVLSIAPSTVPGDLPSYCSIEDDLEQMLDLADYSMPEDFEPAVGGQPHVESAVDGDMSAA